VELCVIEGDGVGHEVIPAALKVLQMVLPEITIHKAYAGYEHLLAHGTPLPEETIEIAKHCRSVLFGAANSPSYPVEGYYEPIIKLRRTLNTYASIRPTSYLPVTTARVGIDLLIVHENTEDLYAVDEQTDETGQSSTAHKTTTRNATELITHKTYQLAMSTGRKRVTIVHKANILPQSDGLFRRVALGVAKEYPDIETDELLVDTAAYWMVKEPTRFDVILTSSMYGDILSDMAAAWGGGLGLIPTLNLGDHAAIAEPVHGSATDIAGGGVSNPTAAILSVAMLLRHHWDMPEVAERIHDAVRAALRAGYHTADISENGALNTADFTECVIRYLE
jgi:homoisocitrate dehydrogenase